MVDIHTLRAKKETTKSYTSTTYVVVAKQFFEGVVLDRQNNLLPHSIPDLAMPLQVDDKPARLLDI